MRAPWIWQVLEVRQSKTPNKERYWQIKIAPLMWSVGTAKKVHL